jgi:hypothetical protein
VSLEPPSLGRSNQRPSRKLAVSKSGEWNDAQRTGQLGHEEPINAITNGTSKQLAQGPRISLICSFEGFQILLAFVLVDDRRRIPITDEQECEHEPSNSTVAIREGMNALEGSVKLGETLNNVAASFLGRIVGRRDPIVDLASHDAARINRQAWPKGVVVL